MLKIKYQKIKKVDKNTESENKYGKMNEWYDSGDHSYRVKKIKKGKLIKTTFNTYRNSYLLVFIDMYNNTKKTDYVGISTSTMKNIK